MPQMIFIPSPWTANTLLTNLVAYWPLDEASGATRVDVHGTNDLANNGTVGQAAGILTNAASFNGTVGNYLNQADNAALSMGNIDFTLTAWVYLTSTAGVQVFVCKGSSAGSAGQEYQLYLNGTFRLDVGNGAGVGSTCNSGVTPSTSTWYFLRAWHDATANVLGIAVNEGTPATTAHTAGSHDSAFEMTIGRWSNFAGGNTTGRICEAGLWKNRVLSSGDGGTLYNGGAGLPYASFL